MEGRWSRMALASSPQRRLVQRYGIQGNKNKEYQGRDGTVEGGDPEG